MTASVEEISFSVTEKCFRMFKLPFSFGKFNLISTQDFWIQNKGEDTFLMAGLRHSFQSEDGVIRLKAHGRKGVVKVVFNHDETTKNAPSHIASKVISDDEMVYIPPELHLAIRNEVKALKKLKVRKKDIAEIYGSSSVASIGWELQCAGWIEYSGSKSWRPLTIRTKRLVLAVVTQRILSDYKT